MRSPVPTIAGRAALLASALIIAGCSAFRSEPPPVGSTAAPESKAEATAEKAAEIATQPVRDLGAGKPEIPAPLVRATEAPYSPTSTATCEELTAAITELNEHLGPDYMLSATPKDENKAGKIAEAGGKAIVNSIIPFRGLVREISGAAEAQRRYADAIDAGYARRGYLRGLQTAKTCPPLP